MIIAFGIIILILILLAVLLFSEFLVILSVSEKNLILKIKILHITVRIPLHKKDDTKKPKKKPETSPADGDSVMQKFLEMRNTFTRIRTALGETLSYLNQKIKIQDSGVVGSFGLGNPATTGMAYGAVEAFAGVVVGFLQQFFRFEKAPYRNITMEYDNLVFELKFALIGKTKLIYLVKAALIFLKHFKK